MEKYKCVLSIRIAKILVAKDYKLVDIQPSNKFPGKLVFVFLNSKELEEEMIKHKKERR